MIEVVASFEPPSDFRDALNVQAARAITKYPTQIITAGALISTAAYMVTHFDHAAAAPLTVPEKSDSGETFSCTPDSKVGAITHDDWKYQITLCPGVSLPLSAFGAAIVAQNGIDISQYYPDPAGIFPGHLGAERDSSGQWVLTSPTSSTFSLARDLQGDIEIKLIDRSILIRPNDLVDILNQVATYQTPMPAVTPVIPTFPPPDTPEAPDFPPTNTQIFITPSAPESSQLTPSLGEVLKKMLDDQKTIVLAGILVALGSFGLLKTKTRSHGHTHRRHNDTSSQSSSDNQWTGESPPDSVGSTSPTVEDKPSSPPPQDEFWQTPNGPVKKYAPPDHSTNQLGELTDRPTYGPKDFHAIPPADMVYTRGDSPIGRVPINSDFLDDPAKLDLSSEGPPHTPGSITEDEENIANQHLKVFWDRFKNDSGAVG